MKRPDPLLLKLQAEIERLKRQMMPRSGRAEKTYSLPIRRADLSIKEMEKLDHTCPRCGETKNMYKDFGVRRDTKTGAMKYQSWCRQCRNSNASHPSRKGLEMTYIKGGGGKDD